MADNLTTWSIGAFMIQHRDCCAGFTLIELTVVLLILTIALGLVLPEASSLIFRNSLQTSARRLAGAVSYARSQAMVEGRPWKLVVDLDNNSYWLAAGTGNADAGHTRKRSLESGVRFVDVEIPGQDTRTAGQVTIHFNPKGLAEPAVLHIEGSGNKVRTLRIKAFNGRLVILDGYVRVEG
ncbi:MAG: GspH/FimT family pseudopilin [Deltaproteobacteria bacterium]|nr:GspH/FimT family pseudopilin [Deltaproteobacteria bacterium]MBW2073039.1 GspH/FimT family pseudopilin [Deltaproteobacteria bacterium]